MVGIQPDTSPSDSSTEQHIFCWFHSKCFKIILTMAGGVVRWFVWRFAYEQIRFCAEPYCIFCGIIKLYKYVYAHNYVFTWFSWTRTHTCIYYNLPYTYVFISISFTKRNEQALVYCGIIPGKGWAKAEWGHLRDGIDGRFSNYLDWFIDFIINFWSILMFNVSFSRRSWNK